MADNMRMSFILDFAAKTAGLLDSAKLTRALGDDLDDTTDDAEQLARAMSAAADMMEADLADAKRMASALGTALGPELTAKIGQTRLDGIAREFQSVGLSVDQVEGNIDGLANGVRRLETAADKAGPSVRRIGDTSDRARSNMANFAGNMASELPLISGALGPLNVGIGQMAEGLAEGAVNWKQMLSAGLAMGVAAVVLQGLTDDTNDLAKAQREAMRAKLVETWADALYEARGAVSGLTDMFRDTGRVVAYVDTAVGRMGVDFTSMFADAGLTVEDWTTALSGGAEGLVDFETKLKVTNLTAEQQDTIMRALATAQELYAEVVDVSSDRVKVMGDVTEAAGRKAENADGKMRNLADTIAETGENAQDTDEDLRGLRDAMDAIDKSDAVLDLEDQFVDLKKKAEAAWIATATGAEDADEKVNDYQQSLNDTKYEVKAYADEVGGIPDKAITDVFARLDDGSITSAEQAIAELEKSRTTTLTVIAKQGGSSAAWAAIGGGLGTIGKDNESEPTRTNTAGASRGGGDTYNINVTVTSTPGASPTETGMQIAEAIQRAYSDGFRYPWMGATP